MGNPIEPLPVKLVMPMLSRETRFFQLAQRALGHHFGPVDYRSPELPFEHTTYYEEEFGSELLRQFMAFERLADPGRLAQIKLLTNGLEQEWSVAGRRRINLDPGYISASKFVLATTKNHGHRIYLGQGIYAEVTLTYRDKDYRPWPWTYPDYRSEAYLAILRAIRGIYMAQLKAVRAARRTTRRSG